MDDDERQEEEVAGENQTADLEDVDANAGGPAADEAEEAAENEEEEGGEPEDEGSGDVRPSSFPAA
jgi:hypothetical protein